MPCVYCGVLFNDLPYGAHMTVTRAEHHRRRATYDHVWPKWSHVQLDFNYSTGSMGTVRCCAGCNSDKGGMTIPQWVETMVEGDHRRERALRVLADHPEPRRKPEGALKRIVRENLEHVHRKKLQSR